MGKYVSVGYNKQKMTFFDARLLSLLLNFSHSSLIILLKAQTQVKGHWSKVTWRGPDTSQSLQSGFVQAS